MAREAAPTRLGPAYAWLLSGVMLALVLSPLARPAGADSFPFSGYPMFAHGRDTAVTDVHHLVGFTADGTRRPVPPRLVANDEVLQADVTLRRAVRRGKKAATTLCRTVAARVAEHPAWTDIVRLELRSEQFDAVRYFAGDTETLKPPKIRAKCKVKR